MEHERRIVFAKAWDVSLLKTELLFRVIFNEEWKDHLDFSSTITLVDCITFTENETNFDEFAEKIVDSFGCYERNICFIPIVADWYVEYCERIMEAFSKIDYYDTDFVDASDDEFLETNLYDITGMYAERVDGDQFRINMLALLCAHKTARQATDTTREIWALELHKVEYIPDELLDSFMVKLTESEYRSLALEPFFDVDVFSSGEGNIHIESRCAEVAKNHKSRDTRITLLLFKGLGFLECKEMLEEALDVDVFDISLTDKTHRVGDHKSNLYTIDVEGEQGSGVGMCVYRSHPVEMLTRFTFPS